MNGRSVAGQTDDATGREDGPLGDRFDRLPVRHKLLALVLVPLLVVLPLLGLLLLVWGDQAIDRLLITKVRSDLAVANGYFERVLAEVGAGTASIASSHSLHKALDGGHDGATATLLARQRDIARLDFVVLRGVDGQLRLGSEGPAGVEPGQSTALRVGRVAGARVELLTRQELAAFAPSLADRVSIALIATRNAAPSGRTAEDRALVLLASHPVHSTDGTLRGHVQAGVLLNRNLDFIDHVNEIVYPEGSLPFGSRGTATLFLEDVRVSTNVRLFGGEAAERAIGTQVSKAVRDVVLGQGRTWLDRAFVVDDWYVSGYQPLENGDGRRVGMLYVGFTEAPFRWMKAGALLSIGAIFFGVMIAGAWLSLRGARRIFAPLERMARTMRRVEEGESQARFGAAGGGDEIARLGGHLDHLLDTIDDKARALRQLNAELDAKVAERTAELRAAQDHLVRSEKLATVGQLTASIAHEINNPIAVIQGNLDLMRELLGPDQARVRGEMQLVDEQIERMRVIVTQLLQYARPGEFAGYVEPLDLNRLVTDSLRLARHLPGRGAVMTVTHLDATRLPATNRAEMQQVMVNLLVNAIHAMPEGGTLTLQSVDADRGGLRGAEIRVSDTGPGLGPALIGELFKPFVTRKKDGTGLGLWISRSIVERYGGTLEASDRDDGVRGARFTMWLPAEQASDSADRPQAASAAGP